MFRAWEDSKWDIRTEIIVASIAVSFIVASYAARRQRREDAASAGLGLT